MQRYFHIHAHTVCTDCESSPTKCSHRPNHVPKYSPLTYSEALLPLRLCRAKPTRIYLRLHGWQTHDSSHVRTPFVFHVEQSMALYSAINSQTIACAGVCTECGSQKKTMLTMSIATPMFVCVRVRIATNFHAAFRMWGFALQFPCSVFAYGN